MTVDLEAVSARWQLARMAGEDADYNGWDKAKIAAMVRSWQDIYDLVTEVREHRAQLDPLPRRALVE